MSSFRGTAIVIKTILAAVAVLSSLAAAALADEPPPKPVKVKADLGYVSTAGNTEVQTLTGTEKVEYKTGRWLFTQNAAAVWGTEKGAETAGRYLAGLRGERNLSKRFSFYGVASWDRNVYAAISREFIEDAGITYHALIPNPHQLDLEVGAGATQRHTTLDEQENFGNGRLALDYRYYFQEKAYFEADGVYLSNFGTPDDYQWVAKAALVAPLSNVLAMKLGYNYAYRNEPPADVKKWDSTFAAGVQVTY
jgi:putative salt-induced outer membrane protein